MPSSCQSRGLEVATNVERPLDQEAEDQVMRSALEGHTVQGWILKLYRVI